MLRKDPTIAQSGCRPPFGVNLVAAYRTIQRTEQLLIWTEQEVDLAEIVDAKLNSNGAAPDPRSALAHRPGAVTHGPLSADGEVCDERSTPQ